MRKIIAMIVALLSGTLGISMVCAGQAAYSVAGNATNVAEAVGSISALSAN